MAPSFLSTLVILTIFDVFALLYFQKYRDTNNNKYIIIGLIFYNIIGLLLVYSTKFKNIAVINTLWNGLSIIFVALISHYLFKINFTKNEITAMILVVIAVILIQIDPHKTIPQ